MNEKFDNLKNTGGWIGVGTAIGAAFSWKKPKK